MKRSLFAMMIAVIMLLSVASFMAACGGNAGDDEDEMTKVDLAGATGPGGAASSIPSAAERPAVSPSLPGTSSHGSDSLITNTARPDVAISVTPATERPQPTTTSYPEYTTPGGGVATKPPTTATPTPTSSTTLPPYTTAPVLTVRHHLDTNDGSKCWCESTGIHISSNNQGDHNEYDCWCIKDYGDFDNTRHHLVDARKWPDSTDPDYICWCGVYHEYFGFQHTSDINCACWVYDNIQLKVAPENDTEKP